jgi:hypothetical protein
MTSEGIPLREVPDHFFEPAKWKQLVELCGGPQQALAQISIPWLSSFAAQLNAPEMKLANLLVEQFLTALRNGEYLATGYDPEERCRTEFQPEDWDRYGLNFAEDETVGGKRKFTHVQVFRRDDRPESEKVSDRCVSWLRELKSRGDVNSKKVLEGEAFKRFGSDLTTRLFDRAYKAVFNKKRGRPRKEERE